MNQDQQPRRWWKDNWPVLALVALLVVIAPVTVLGYWQRWAWTELLWRWLELLIIPVVLAAGAFWFNTQSRRRELEQELARRKSEQELALQAREAEQELARRERENDREIAQDRVREEALQRYLDRMQELIIDKGLRRSEKYAEIREVARARTLTVLRSLDGNRKSQVVRFLHEADLIAKVVREESGEERVIEAIIDLETADLEGVDLEGADLSHAELDFANLSHAGMSAANLNNANLEGAILSSAGLINATLTGANLRGASLPYAFLLGANLRYANLSYTYQDFADLGGANLNNANLSRANLQNASMGNANLRDAEGWTNKQLAQAESLVGATMPNGTKMAEEGWEEFKKPYRQ
jgi:uncharacterized protein YjbI with pentapeptide repeats